MTVHAKTFNLINYLRLIFIFHFVFRSGMEGRRAVGGAFFFSILFVNCEVFCSLAYTFEEIVENSPIRLWAFLRVRHFAVYVFAWKEGWDVCYRGVQIFSEKADQPGAVAQGGARG